MAEIYENEEDNQEQNEDESEADVSLLEQVEHHIPDIPRELRNLQIFFNPEPQADWENLRGEAAVFTQQETALIATLYEGSPDVRIFMKHKIAQIS
jgi:hypothetical protein